uniref:Uncharacterized protein n=1 Tax=Oryza sativa subsp. japonica TaxID=39947 RepID=Q2R4A4_ORYSJ|nr:hypothetical protein LOC_Os11g29160 [Oryza sativa Japonica Group]
MATSNKFTTKPHIFDGTDFSHWCSRMQSYIMAENYDLGRKVSHPYVIPEAINTVAEKIAFEQNCKARNILLSGISRSDYDHVAHLQSSHEIWIALSNFHQGDSKSSALVSSSTSLDVGASSSKSSVLALFNAMSDDQLEQFEEEDLVLLSNKFSRAMKNVRNRKRGEPNCCFEYGALDHLHSHCPKVGRGKKEDDGKFKEDDMNKKKNMKEKKKYCMQWLIQEIIAAFDESEGEDESKGKQVVYLAFIARNASSDVDESDGENEEKLSYDQLEYAAYKFAKKLQTYSIALDEKDHTIEILNAEIDRLKSSIPDDDNCQSCEVLFSEINTLRDVNSVNCKKLEFEIEKSKKLESSFTLGFALHAHILDELILTNNVLKKIESCFLCKFFGQCFMCK